MILLISRIDFRDLYFRMNDFVVVTLIFGNLIYSVHFHPNAGNEECIRTVVGNAIQQYSSRIKLSSRNLDTSGELDNNSHRNLFGGRAKQEAQTYPSPPRRCDRVASALLRSELEDERIPSVVNEDGENDGTDLELSRASRNTDRYRSSLDVEVDVRDTHKYRASLDVEVDVDVDIDVDDIINLNTSQRFDDFETDIRMPRQAMYEPEEEGMDADYGSESCTTEESKSPRDATHISNSDQLENVSGGTFNAASSVTQKSTPEHLRQPLEQAKSTTESKSSAQQPLSVLKEGRGNSGTETTLGLGASFEDKDDDIALTGGTFAGGPPMHCARSLETRRPQTSIGI